MNASIMPDVVRVGLVGANAAGGSWSTVAHIPAMRAVSGIDLAAVCTRREESAKAAAEAFGIERYFDDIHAMVADDVDLVAVIVKVPGHFDAVKAAIEAGKHVYCEWPLGGSLQETKEMAELCRKHDVVGAVGLQGRRDPHVNHIRDLYRTGWFGELQSVDLRMALPGSTGNGSPPVPGASMFAVVGGHTLDQIQYMFGSIDLVSAIVQGAESGDGRPEPRKRGLLDETAHHIAIKGTLPDGASLHAEIAENADQPPGWALKVQGSEGVLEATSPMLPQIAPIAMRGGKAGTPMAEIVPPKLMDSVLPDAPGGPPRNIAIAYADLAAAIRNGAQFHPNFDDAHDVHRLLCRVQEASDRDQPLESL